jgi:hypothetical protein
MEEGSMRSAAILTSLFLTAASSAEEPKRAEPPKKAPAIKEPKLRTELNDRVKTDQAARMALIDFMKKHGEGGRLDLKKLDPSLKADHDKLMHAVTKADEDNTKWLGGIVEKHGWPTHSLVGKDGAHSAWLLVQHADRDPKFQRKCLDLMAKAKKDEVSQSDVAYLTDRVLLAEGKKQRYATQFTLTDGKWEPRPLEDPANIDKLRKEAGLQPLAEYKKQLEALYGKGKK